jgi:hypothetical protein
MLAVCPAEFFKSFKSVSVCVRAIDRKKSVETSAVAFVVMPALSGLLSDPSFKKSTNC